MADKITIALKRGASCVGCDIAIVNLHENVLKLFEIADIVFAPTLVDTKYNELEAMPDNSITIGFYHGAVRNTENEHWAKVLRQKCQILISYGACAVFGGIPGLANVSNKEGIFKTVYQDTLSTDNPDYVTPQTSYTDKQGHHLTLPEFYDEVLSLDDVVDVDYFVPACPPTYSMNMTILTTVADFVNGKGELPPKGTIFASEKTLCDECDREKPEKIQIDKIYRLSEVELDPKKCFLEQGLICLGPATRAGCDAVCIKTNVPCRGCMGPTSAVSDQGGSMLSAITSIFRISDKETELTEEDIMELVQSIKDPLGTFYRFTLPKSLLRRVVKDKGVK